MTISFEQFTAEFFGPGNDVLAGQDWESNVGTYIAKFLAPLRQGHNQPLILPRKIADRTTAYVISWDINQSTIMRGIIEAFVAHSMVAFDGRTWRLRADDPVDNAVLRLVGEGTTYVLRPSSQGLQAAMWRSLGRLNNLLATKPARERDFARPVSRVIAEFNAALASGAAEASATLLDELSTVGGVAPLNVAYLRVHRLSKLGRDGELMRLPNLNDIVWSSPPTTVADDILAAWGRSISLSGIPSLGSIPSGADQIVGLVTRIDPLKVSMDAAIATGHLAIAYGRTELATTLTTRQDLPTELMSALANVGTVVQPAPPTKPEPETVDERPMPEPRLPGSWTEWAEELASGITASVAEDRWRSWPSPVDADAELADALQSVGTGQVDKVWAMVGPFIETDELVNPSWRSAEALLLHAITDDRWTPADLKAIQALLEIFTRGAPPKQDYRDALDGIGAASARWASVENALPTLDMLDALVRNACPDQDALLRFGTQALEPLYRHRRRLTLENRWLAEVLSKDLDLSWDWSTPGSPKSAETSPRYGKANLLIYSLDTGVIKRVVDGVRAIGPNVTVQTSSSKVGSDQLRSHSRSAQAIALATRCAKHAATGFIRQHAQPDAAIREADGAGSASLIRAAFAALDDWFA